MFCDIRAPTYDDLKSWSEAKYKFLDNKFKPFFDQLALVLVTNNNPQLPFPRADGRPSCGGSDLSTSSNESSHQDSSQWALYHLVSTILERGKLASIIEGWKLTVCVVFCRTW